MRIKTAELTGPALDWAVAEATNTPWYVDHKGRIVGQYGGLSWVYSPSSNWAQGGPLTNLGKIDTFNQNNGFAGAIEMATRANPHPRPYFGPTPLIAICRCYVASKLGDEVDVPEELLRPSPLTNSAS